MKEDRDKWPKMSMEFIKSKTIEFLDKGGRVTILKPAPECDLFFEEKFYGLGDLGEEFI